MKGFFRTAGKAAVALTATAQDSNPTASLLLDLQLVFLEAKADRLFSRTVVAELNRCGAQRPWADLKKDLTELTLSQLLRPYGLRPRTLWIGKEQAKGYYARR